MTAQKIQLQGQGLLDGKAQNAVRAMIVVAVEKGVDYLRESRDPKQVATFHLAR